MRRFGGVARKSHGAAFAARDGRSGELSVKPYAGELEIYKRGFVTVAKGAKHFTYADGTPFFYLGDTHWGLYTEEIDEPGPHAGATGATSDLAGTRTPSKTRLDWQNERSLHCKEVGIQLGRRGVQRATDVRESRRTNG